jgi:hypothetical protein
MQPPQHQQGPPPWQEVAAQYIAAGRDPEAGRLDAADMPAAAGRVRYKHCGAYIVTLELPLDSRTNEGRAIMAADPDHMPCRADKARVLRIEHALTGERPAAVTAARGDATYRVGEITVSDGFWPVYAEQCCPGIHYYRGLGGVYGRMISHGFVTDAQLRERLGAGTRVVLRDSDGILIFDRAL